MQYRNLTLLSFLLACAFLLQQVDSKCNGCNLNGIACVNETSFNLCVNDVPNTSQIFTCPTGTVCTTKQLKCMDIGMVEPDCNPNAQCGDCDGRKMFTCTSRTTFAQCNDNVRTSVTSSCPDGYFCDSSRPQICASECDLEKPECDRETPA